MTDTPSSDTSTEARLRATLRAVADVDPVPDGFADLRHETHDGEAVLDPDWRGPDRSRWLAAAVLAVIVALTAGTIVALSRGDADERIRTRAADPSAPTGFYLPTSLGTAWDLVEVDVYPLYEEQGVVRRVGFLRSTTDDLFPQLNVEVTRGPAPAGPPGTEVARGTGADARLYHVSSSPRPGGPGDVDLTATRGDDTLTLSAFQVEREAVLAVADRWWESGGRVITVDPTLGLQRTYDRTWPGARAPQDGDVDSVVRGAAVSLLVRARAGDLVRFALSPAGIGSRPTGVDADDSGAAAGLSRGERPRPITRSGIDGPAWELYRPEEGLQQVVADLPGAEVSLTTSHPAVEPDSADRETVLDLLAALEPVSAAQWANAVGALTGGDAALGPRLADLSAPTESPPTTTGPVPTTAPIAPSSAPVTTTPPPPPTSTTTTPTTTPPPPVSDLLYVGTRTPPTPATLDAARALAHFARTPNDQTWAALPLAGEVFIEPWPDSTFTPRDPATLRDPAAWSTEVSPGRALSPLDLLRGAGPLQLVRVDDPLSGCPRSAGIGDSAMIVAIVPVARDASCAGWFGIYLQMTGEGLTSVQIALPGA